MTSRKQLLDQVVDRLGPRQLVWSGIRGDDIEPLSDVPQLASSHSIIGAYQGRTDVQGIAYEDTTGVRVDPEVWDIDEHPDEEATAEFRQGLLRALSAPSALLPYRPSQFLSAIHFARRERSLHLGQFGALSSVFDHKPFVESVVADMGLPHIPWKYIADEEQLRARELADMGPLVLRRSRTSGGEGIVRVESAEELVEHWPHVDEAFVSVAPYLSGGLPVNIGATVWPDGPDEDCVTVHHPSVQLIGVPSLVTREFGYCGNDFGLATDLDRSTIDQVEVSTMRIGAWLRHKGYVGTFGIDYLIHEGAPLFTEVNPRFQGSTQSSCRLSIEADEACLMLEHVAAWLGVDRPETPTLWDRTRTMRDLSNVIAHWTGTDTRQVHATSLYSDVLAVDESRVRGDVLVPPTVANASGSLVARFSLSRRVTTTGYDLVPELDDVVTSWTATEVPG